MRQIALSYRRADSAAMTGRIFDELSRHFGMDDVFMDIDAIPLGIDFRHYINDALQQAKIVVVIVGPRWLGSRRAGQYRIMEETDPVRIEVETAMRLQIPVVPVLVDGAQMPRPADLPETLRDFSYKNAAEIDSGRDFHPHMSRLKKFLETVVGEPAPAAAQPDPPPAAAEPDPPPVAVEPEPPPAPAPERVPEPVRAPVLVAERAPEPAVAAVPSLAEFLAGAARPATPPAVPAPALVETAIPAELLAKWSWGPFFVPWLWVWWNAGAGPKVVGLLVLISLFVYFKVGIVVCFAYGVFLGLKGNSIMVAHRHFTRPEELVRVQRAWARWGLVVFLAELVVLSIVLVQTEGWNSSTY
ncbi:MAG: toll/interleukin-1 receptor domain-containing protein [Candidatus Eremiobacteraeota bacterium]|nr:toll/interleukin-1 receptor domain-containing protein [Candidatus Eremiobacteraeota bacterium]